MTAEPTPASRDHVVPEALTVRFTDQQIVMLEQLVAEGRHGSTLEDVIQSLFREHVRATFAHVRI